MAVKEKKDKTKKIGPAAPSAVEHKDPESTSASAQVNKVEPVVATEAEFSSSMEEGTPYVAPEGAQLPESEIMPTTSVEESAGVAEEASENEAPSVSEPTPEEGGDSLYKDFGFEDGVEEAEAEMAKTSVSASGSGATESTEPTPTSMAELFEMFNPNPERSKEEQETFEKNRRSSAIILSIADAINGLSNLGATVAGAPSREITSLTGKWAEALNASEEKRQQKVDNWYANRLKFQLKDFENAQAEAKAKAKEKRDNDEWDRRQGVQHKNQMDTMAQQFENQKEMAKIDAQMRKDAAKAKAEADEKQAKIEHDYKMKEIAASKGGNGGGSGNTKPKYFVSSVEGTPVDVYLRNDTDYPALFTILANQIKADNDNAQERDRMHPKSKRTYDYELAEELKEAEKSVAKQKDIVNKYFGKYYFRIKDLPGFKHLDIQLKDSDGNVIKPERKSEVSGNLTPTSAALPYETGAPQFSSSAVNPVPANPTPTKTMPWRNK